MANKFLLKDLREGMIVELRNYERYIYFQGRLMGKQMIELSSYNEDLDYIRTSNERKDEYDIIKIFDAEGEKIFERTLIPFKLNQTYFYIDDCLEIGEEKWTYSGKDVLRFKRRNAFVTREETEMNALKNRITNKLLRWRDEHDNVLLNWNENSEKFYFVYNEEDNKIEIASTRIWKLDTIYFSNCDKAKEALRYIGESRLAKYYFNSTALQNNIEMKEDLLID